MRGASVRFRFRGKSGKQHEVGLRDRRLATIVRRCQDLPGPGPVPVRRRRMASPSTSASDDVNAYLREVSGADVTAKDFRTWAATVLAYRALRGMVPGHARARRPQAGRPRRSASPPTGWATRRRSRAAATSTRPSSTRTSTARSGASAGRRTSQPRSKPTSTAAGLPDPAERGGRPPDPSAPASRHPVARRPIGASGADVHARRSPAPMIVSPPDRPLTEARSCA